MLGFSAIGKRQSNRGHVEDFEPRKDMFEVQEGRQDEQENSNEAGLRRERQHQASAGANC